MCVTICVGTLCYSFSFSNQTDYGDETEDLERQGLKNGEIGKGHIGEGGCEATNHYLSIT